jgi:hypothetical protein
MNKHQATWRAAVLAAATLAASPFATASPNVNVSVEGVIKPGVYGRVEIGNRPPPPVIYPQPVIIMPVATAAPAAPIYLHVPPGHAKKWHKHCAKYNACGQPVYFVKPPASHRAKPHHHHDDDDDHRQGHGKGKGKHKGDRDDD